MDVEIFNFDLPEDRIALRPASPRDSARLLQVSDGNISDCIVTDLPSILRPGDILVLNETKVLRASLEGIRPARAHGGGTDVNVHLNLHQHVSANQWRAFARPAKRLKIGDTIRFSDAFHATVFDKSEGGEIGLEFNLGNEELDRAIEQFGDMPLPPYIARKRAVDERDVDDYQTIFASNTGSVAAPTAGLHFTPALFEKLANAGVETQSITLHVGAGTFLPVTHADTDLHEMHSEWYSISDQVADFLNKARKDGRRIIAVGTTALRALESSVSSSGEITAQAKDTSIFITPGYTFKIVDGLLTNFHLPKSTLYMLVCAVAGIETMQEAYRYAIDGNYRFYSYGDTSLLWKSSK